MEVARRFGGRPYFDLTSLQWAIFDALGVKPAEMNRTTGGYQPEIPVDTASPFAGRSHGLRTGRGRGAAELAPG
jgi:hypothetical protein